MKRIILLLTLVLFAAPALAEPNDAFKAIITQQLQAIARDDAGAAYAEAAPNVQRIFPSPEIFMNMVRGGYAAVYRNKQYHFGESGVDASGRPFQRVEIVGLDGQYYSAIYFMEQQADGSWKISGVVMAQSGSDV